MATTEVTDVLTSRDPRDLEQTAQSSTPVSLLLNLRRVGAGEGFEVCRRVSEKNLHGYAQVARVTPDSIQVRKRW
ncbi:MAG TPA: hypothetical protein VMS40_09030, partial [Vicinamibacterales bacterium]|nr:hypothetical protein [Vicinamibacterales bacterium]